MDSASQRLQILIHRLEFMESAGLETIFNNIPFYQYGGRVESPGFKEHYGMPRGHWHDPMYSHQYLRALFGANFSLSFP